MTNDYNPGQYAEVLAGIPDGVDPAIGGETVEYGPDTGEAHRLTATTLGMSGRTGTLSDRRSTHSGISHDFCSLQQ